MTSLRHTFSDLTQMRSLSLDRKVLMTEQRIRAWYEHYDGLVYVSFSGGKDSTVLKYLVDSLYNDVPSVFVNTGLEFPEVRRFALMQKNVVRLDPKMKFYDVIARYGYPVVSKEQSQYISEARSTKSEKLRAIRLYGKGEDHRGKISERWKFLLNAPFKISNKCCEIMKKSPAERYEKATERKAILGTLAEESRLRLSSWLRFGCNAFEKSRPTSQPLSFWTEQDILRFISENNLQIASVYGEIKKRDNGEFFTTGRNRTGCMFCMYGCHQEPSPNRFEQMKTTHPKQYEYCMNTLKLKEVLDYMNVPH